VALKGPCFARSTATQAPDVMRSCSMALCLLSTAFGSYAAGALTAAVQVISRAATGKEWLPRDLNQVRLRVRVRVRRSGCRAT
jgi:hypothetical protein